jgi:hypothetical protein
MKFPKLPIKGVSVKETVREIINYLRSSRIHSVIGGRIKETPNGSVLYIDKVKRSSALSIPDDFLIYGVRYDAELSTYYAKVVPGYVLNPNPALADPAVEFMTYHMPLIQGDPDKVPMDTVPAIEIEWEDGQMIAVRVQTDPHDIVKTDPDLLVEVLAADETEIGVHFQPADPEQSGTDGDYYYKLATFEIDGDNPAIVTVTQWHHGGPIIHRPNLWTGENVGSGARVYKTRDREDDTYDFRNILGNYGVTAAEDGGDIVLDFDAENVGTAFEVLVGPPDPLTDDPAQFRTISQGPSGRQQIEIAYDTPADIPASTNIQVMGNAKNGSLLFETCGGDPLFTLSWEDGLITNAAGATILVPICPATT